MSTVRINDMSLVMRQELYKYTEVPNLKKKGGEVWERLSFRRQENDSYFLNIENEMSGGSQWAIL